jgi:hypothetical protein
MNVRSNLSTIGLALLAQALWVTGIAVSAAILAFLFGTSDIHRILDRNLSVPAWVILIAALLVLVFSIVLLAITRKASVVRGRQDATQGNLALLKERSKVALNSRIIRSTRFGRWPQGEVLEQRSSFRQELDTMILQEGADVRRIWNVSSIDDLKRLREILEKYRGHGNHSLRAYFELPDHALPELLVVEHRGASMSFPSTRSPRELDWMIRFRREDLVDVVRDYFDVLWDRAERMLDAGELAPGCLARLGDVERSLNNAPSV